MSDIITHHFLERRADKRLEELQALQSRARNGSRQASQELRDLGISSSTVLRTRKAGRGPWRWYVVRVAR